MNSEFQLFSILLLLAAGQGIFLSLALITSKLGNWQANRYLGLFTFLIAITIVDFSMDSSDTSDGALFLRGLVWPRDYLYGPALYFYVREMTLPSQYAFMPCQWLHFFPALCHIVVYWSLPFLNPALHQAILIDSINTTSALEKLVESANNFEIISSIVHVSIYLWLSVDVLRGHRKRTNATFSYNERINLNWLRNLLYGVIAIYVIWFFEEFLADWIGLGSTFYNLLGISLVLLIYTMSYLGLRQPIIFSSRAASLVISDESTSNDAEKYKTSSLSDDLSQKLVDELQQLMVREQPYLNSQLSLPQLADQLGVSVNYLSQIINEQLEQNFFDFVNDYRIKQAKTRLRDPNHKKDNILTIATDAGFNSKSSFYTAFKKHAGMTPGNYRKLPVEGELEPGQLPPNPNTKPT